MLTHEFPFHDVDILTHSSICTTSVTIFYRLGQCKQDEIVYFNALPLGQYSLRQASETQSGQLLLTPKRHADSKATISKKTFVVS